jgi:hypothetical protein
MDWTRLEVELVVADYFAMLLEEMAGRRVDKSAHRRALKPLLNGRSDGSIEFKHQNISAVLINFDQPYINGYKPRQNYQALLEQVVLEFLESDRQLQQVVEDSPVINPPAMPPQADGDVLSLIVEPPEPRATQSSSSQAARRAVRIDFVERDARNRQLGRQGEEWALELEKRRLHDVDKRRDLSRRVEWVAQTRGDGLGYDIASYNRDGSPRLIEVKTTGLGKHFPFYVTANELDVSREQAAAYQLYRVFDFSSTPRMYALAGALDAVCRLEPKSFVGRVG